MPKADNLACGFATFLHAKLNLALRLGRLLALGRSQKSVRRKNAATCNPDEDRLNLTQKLPNQRELLQKRSISRA
jgi:hypothetical protein